MDFREEFLAGIDQVIEQLLTAKEAAVQNKDWEVAFAAGSAHGVMLRTWAAYAESWKQR